MHIMKGIMINERVFLYEIRQMENNGEVGSGYWIWNGPTDWCKYIHE